MYDGNAVSTFSQEQGILCGHLASEVLDGSVEVATNGSI